MAFYHEKTQGEPRWQPIPLTEEWLLKFGFEKTCNGCFLFDLNDSENAHYLLVDIDAFGVLLSDAYYELLTKHVKKVHQIQKLYFALTGEELKINL